ncbi:MAG TPA: ThiF family adenylyltransferase [Pyrinomonadaceae bacterium]|nr:ThiF family adenylyltransferase [Pyrinomonadaceae bacterium]
MKEQAHGAITFSNRYLRRALLRVRERGLAGFLTVHTHPGCDIEVGFSPYDDANDPELMQNLYELQPAGIFGSVVLGKRAVAARVWSPKHLEPLMLDEMVIIGEQLEFLQLDGTLDESVPDPLEIFDRSLAITGKGAQRRLSRMRVAVVGASGTGSLMLELLTRAGVGEIVIFEFDDIKDHNLNRIVHSRKSDADAGTNKATRLAEALNETGLPTKITIIEGGDITEERVALELRGCDLIFGCVDNRDWPRLVMTEVAHQYLIPYIDLGTEIGIDDIGIQSLDSRVSYVAPGRACLLCSGIVTEERVRLEGLDADERTRVLAMGYSKDVPLKAPAVMDLNMRAASYAMFVFRHLLQPFLDIPLPTHIKEGLTNYNIKRICSHSRKNCDLCGRQGRHGMGDSVRLTTRRDN